MDWREVRVNFRSMELLSARLITDNKQQITWSFVCQSWMNFATRWNFLWGKTTEVELVWVFGKFPSMRAKSSELLMRICIGSLGKWTVKFGNSTAALRKQIKTNVIDRSLLISCSILLTAISKLQSQFSLPKPNLIVHEEENLKFKLECKNFSCAVEIVGEKKESIHGCQLLWFCD
jgi:hypothetical protein